MDLNDPDCAPSVDIAPSIAILLVKLGRDAQRAFAEALKPTSLRPRHLATLHILRRGPQNQQTLSESVGVEPSNFVGLLDDLEAEDLAQRRRDPSDRRRHIVEITQRGHDLLATFDDRVASVDERLLDDLSEDERAQLKTLLIRIAESAGFRENAGEFAERVMSETAIVGG